MCSLQDFSCILLTSQAMALALIHSTEPSIAESHHIAFCKPCSIYLFLKQYASPGFPCFYG